MPFGGFDALSLLLGGVQTLFEADKVRREGDAQIAEDTSNMALAEHAQADATARGNIEAGRLRIRGSQLAAKQLVGYANSGVDATVGSAADVQANSRAMSELDAQTAQNNAAREAWGFGKQAEKFSKQRELDKQRQRSGLLGTYLTGFSRFAEGAARATDYGSKE